MRKCLPLFTLLILGCQSNKDYVPFIELAVPVFESITATYDLSSLGYPDIVRDADYSSTLVTVGATAYDKETKKKVERSGFTLGTSTFDGVDAIEVFGGGKDFSMFDKKGSVSPYLGIWSHFIVADDWLGGLDLIPGIGAEYQISETAYFDLGFRYVIPIIAMEDLYGHGTELEFSGLAIQFGIGFDLGVSNSIDMSAPASVESSPMISSPSPLELLRKELLAEEQRLEELRKELLAEEQRLEELRKERPAEQKSKESKKSSSPGSLEELFDIAVDMGIADLEDWDSDEWIGKMMAVGVFYSSREHWNLGTGEGSGYHWRRGTSKGSDDHWRRGTGEGSGYHWRRGTSKGSDDHWRRETGEGSGYHWRRGTSKGSAYHWRKGTSKGSKAYWGNIPD